MCQNEGNFVTNEWQGILDQTQVNLADTIEFQYCFRRATNVEVFHGSSQLTRNSILNFKLGFCCFAATIATLGLKITKFMN
jgi:hypothetical protein